MSADTVINTRPAMAKCDGCGLETNVPGLLQTRRKSFRRKRVQLCASCLVDSLKYAQRTNWVILGACAAFAILVAVVTGDYEIASTFVLWFAAIFVFSPMSVAIHELGHALVARVVNWQLCGIILGFGKILWQGRRGDVLLQFRFIQMGGLTWCAPRQNDSLLPLQALVIFAAGPAVNALAAWGGWIVFDAQRTAGSRDSIVMMLSGIWVFLNGFNAVMSLLPYKSSFAGVSLGSDGYQMLQALFKPSDLRSRYVYGSTILRLASLRQLGELDGAREAVNEHLHRYPDDVMGLQCLSAIHSESGNYEECIRVSRRALELLEQGVEIHPAVMSGQTPLFRKVIEAALQCNLAYAMLRGNLASPDEALQHAQQALESVPWMPGVAHTYGYALARAGDPVQGLDYMKKNMEKLQDEPDHVKKDCAETLKEIEALAAAGVGKEALLSSAHTAAD